MAWMFLFAAGMLEIVWVIALKMSEGFSKLIPSSVMVVSLISSMLLLGLSARSLPIGVAYAIWTGIGAIGAVLAGTVLFKEPCSFLHAFFLSMIIIGIVGIKFVSPE